MNNASRRIAAERRRSLWQLSLFVLVFAHCSLLTGVSGDATVDDDVGLGIVAGSPFRTVGHAPDNETAVVLGVHALLAPCRSGSTMLFDFATHTLAPALRGDDDQPSESESESDDGGGGGARRAATVFIIRGEANIRRESALAARGALQPAGSGGRDDPADVRMVMTQLEMVWGLHREPEVSSLLVDAITTDATTDATIDVTATAEGRPPSPSRPQWPPPQARRRVGYFLLLRDPVARAVSEWRYFAVARREPRHPSAPLATAALGGGEHAPGPPTVVPLLRYAQNRSNYALRFLTRTAVPAEELPYPAAAAARTAAASTASDGDDNVDNGGAPRRSFGRGCSLRRSHCASLTAFDASVSAFHERQRRGEEGDAAGADDGDPGDTDDAVDCHLEYHAEEAARYSCALSDDAQPHARLVATLATLAEPGRLARLFVAVGVVERAAESLVRAECARRLASIFTPLLSSCSPFFISHVAVAD
jgi:hypothetical protein